MKEYSNRAHVNLQFHRPQEVPSLFPHHLERYLLSSTVGQAPFPLPPSPSCHDHQPHICSLSQHIVQTQSRVRQRLVRLRGPRPWRSRKSKSRSLAWQRCRVRRQNESFMQEEHKCVDIAFCRHCTYARSDDPGNRSQHHVNYESVLLFTYPVGRLLMMAVSPNPHAWPLENIRLHSHSSY